LDRRGRRERLVELEGDPVEDEPLHVGAKLGFE
jgi:hypothetical protein